MSAISQMLFVFKAASGGAAAGQQVFTTSTSWTVPAGVTSICMVCVQPGGDTSTNGTQVTVASTVVCRAKNGARIGDGGGNGGVGANSLFDPKSGQQAQAGGGGAGGYAGNGGNGGTANNPGANGSGGGGGGGAGIPNAPARGGGGVGLLGQGSNGTGGTSSTAATGGSGGASGSGPSGGAYGGGAGATSGVYNRSQDGGALSYTNNVSVTPGSTVTIDIPSAGVNGGGTGGAGAVRILWGSGRAYPSTNTGDV